MDHVEKFRKLFVGGSQAHGEWHPGNAHGEQAVTRHTEASPGDYSKHLEGKIGLGLVPVHTNGTCRFAAIDIDVDTIDHAELYRAVTARKIPVTVCRSKSGGAHLYCFFEEPGLKASTVRRLLGDWARVLGYPTAEIFPKQDKVSEKNIGSWINLPYFGGDETTRYAVGAHGALGLEEFLSRVRYYNPDDKVDAAPSASLATMPPCLRCLTETGLGEGQRNQGLFNFAVFYRKSDPANWEQRVRDHNKNFVSPPLSDREVQGVFNSVGRTKYQYTCGQAPVSQYCDEVACKKVKFGVGHKPWQEDGSFEDITVSNCRRLNSNPPLYIVDVNGLELELAWEDLFVYQKFRGLVGKKLNIVAPLLKQPQWEMQVKILLDERQEIMAPEDASLEGLVKSKFHEFLSLRERADSKDDLARGLPVTEGSVVLFRMADFKHYLQGFKLDKLEGPTVFNLLRRDGCEYKVVDIQGKFITVWAYPVSKVNEQTRDFAVADFSRDFGEEI
jgi:hypothetical protein